MSTPEAGLRYRGLYRTSSVPSCVLSLEDLRKLFFDLQQKTSEGVELQLSAAQRPAETAEEDFSQAKASARDATKLTLMVWGARGHQLMADEVSAIDRPLLPDEITAITLDSAVSFRNFVGSDPVNRFQLRFDFSESPGFNQYNPWDRPTPNNSGLEINGTNETWVGGVQEYVEAFLRHRETNRGWLHTEGFFNLANYLIGFPVGFWLIYRFDELASSWMAQVPGVLRSGIFIYAFLLVLAVFRGLIYLLRWVYPLVELEGSKRKKYRGWISLAISTLFLTLVYDVIKAAVTG